MEANPVPSAPATTPAVNPAVHVEITGPEYEDGRPAMERRWVLQNEFQAPDTRFPELEIGYRWDNWRGPSLNRFTTFVTGDNTVLIGRNGDPESLRTLRLNEHVALDEDHSFTVLAAELHGRVEQIAETVEGADFFHTAPAAIRIRVKSTQSSRELLLSAESDELGIDGFQYTGPDGEERLLYLHFHEDMDDLPVEWRSKLSFFEMPEGGAHPEPVDAGEIRVNDYFNYKGFRFFQTDAKPTDPTYSGVGVVYDPGIPAVLAGLYMVMGGAILVFVLVPLLSSKRRKG